MILKEDSILYFKKVIDWKLFDYMLLILTEYHDQGYDTGCSVSLETFKNHFEPIYQEGEKQIWFSDEDDEYIKQTIIAYLMGAKICYFFKIMPKDDVSLINSTDESKKHITELKNKILEEIQKKYKIDDFIMNSDFSVRFKNYRRI